MNGVHVAPLLGLSLKKDMNTKLKLAKPVIWIIVWELLHGQNASYLK